MQAKFVKVCQKFAGFLLEVEGTTVTNLLRLSTVSYKILYPGIWLSIIIVRMLFLTFNNSFLDPVHTYPDIF